MRPVIAACLSIAVLGLAAVPKPRVKLTTSLGAIVLELEPEAAPRTVENFLKYMKRDNTRTRFSIVSSQVS